MIGYIMLRMRIVDIDWWQNISSLFAHDHCFVCLLFHLIKRVKLRFCTGYRMKVIKRFKQFLPLGLMWKHCSIRILRYDDERFSFKQFYIM